MDELASIRSQKIGLWCSPIFSVLTVIGWLWIGHFYMPAPADLGLEATKEWFTETHKWGTIIGCSIFYVACGFLVPASIQFGIMLAKIEGKWPLWSLTAGVSGIFISLIIFLNACAWIVCAYRPEYGADVIQAFYDWAWFAFLLGWIYLTVEMIASGVVELQDTRPVPMTPRWLAWATLGGAITLVTAAGPAFFKSGPFAYHGILGFYLPMVIWGLYVNLTAWYMYQELRREERELSSGSIAGSATPLRQAVTR